MLPIPVFAERKGPAGRWNRQNRYFFSSLLKVEGSALLITGKAVDFPIYYYIMDKAGISVKIEKLLDF